jgi:hypothetical protein
MLAVCEAHPDGTAVLAFADGAIVDAATFDRRGRIIDGGLRGGATWSCFPFWRRHTRSIATRYAINLTAACDAYTRCGGDMALTAAACVYAAERNVDLRKACEAVRR